MAEKMKDFLADVSKDITKLNAFKDNPDAVMDAAGLSNAEKAIILSGDRELIANAISPGAPHAAGVTVVILVIP